MIFNRRQFIASVALVTLGLSSQAWSDNTQAWPDKPIRLIVPYTPGGGTDTVTRQLADTIKRDTDWNFVIDNRPGAGGNIGLNQVARAAADGYTFAMGQTSNLAINPAAMAQMPFDASKDLVPVALVAELPMVLVVRTDAPWKTLGDLVDAAKAKPGALNQAIASIGTVGHLAGILLADRAGFTVAEIPYNGASPALSDLLGGQTDYMFATPQSVMGMLKVGKLRALAVTAAKRNPALPDVPTVAEQGYPGLIALDWKVIVAPKGIPDDIVQRMNAAVDNALTQPALTEAMAATASTPMRATPQEAEQFVRSEQEKWAELIRKANIRFE